MAEKSAGGVEIKILEKSDRVLEFELPTEGHTFCNLLAYYLNEDPEVEYAAYRIDHPLLGIPRVIVRTREGKSPLEALLDAVERIEKDLRELREKFSKALESS